jgi:hypothetical protein
MTRDEFQVQLRQLRWQEPFQPFTIELLSGERIDVDRPDGLAFSEGFGVFDAGDDFHEFRSEDVARIVTAHGTPTA